MLLSAHVYSENTSKQTNKRRAYLSVRAVKVPVLDDLDPRVGPVEALGLVVDGQAIGPRQVGRNDDRTVGRIHPRSLDLWVGAPVGPIHQPGDIYIYIYMYTSLSMGPIGLDL